MSPLRPDLKYGPLLLSISLAMMFCAARGGWWLCYVWPSVSFAIAAVAYFTVSVSLFGKRPNGTRHWLATILVFPYLCLFYLAWCLKVLISREAAFHTINPSLILGRRLTASEYPANVTLICDLTAELCDPASIRTSPGYRCLPILDANTLPTSELATFVRQLRIETGGCLLIHCANGHGRAPLVAAAWLVYNGFAATVDEAVEQLKASRTGVNLRSRQRTSLELVVQALVAPRHVA